MQTLGFVIHWHIQKRKKTDITLHMVPICSKILNASCLPKWPRQTVQNKIRLLLQVQTNIRLLLKKQSDIGLHCLLF